MLSDLLGASAMGLRNLLLITGDPPKMGPYPDATAVFDIDAIGLTNLVSRLNHGLDPGGNEIGDTDAVRDWRRRESRGGRSRRTSCGGSSGRSKRGRSTRSRSRCSTSRSWNGFSNRSQHVRIPIIAGIWPLVSVRNAEFLANEVPGVHGAGRR